MSKRNIVSGIILLVYSISCYFLYQNQIIAISDNTITSSIIQTKNEQTEAILATLIIDKIHLEQPIYPINSTLNQVDKHVTILKGSILPTEENSIVFLAAHSGEGNIAFFNDLDKLSIKDIIKFTYQNQTYLYEVYNIEEQDKTGIITIPKQQTKALVLTTCSKQNQNKQLVILCKLK